MANNTQQSRDIFVRAQRANETAVNSSALRVPSSRPSLPVGVNTAIASPTGASAGIGFAVPVDTVNRVIPQLLAAGTVTRPYAGLTPSDTLSREIFRRLGVQGTMILGIDPGSPAERASLRAARQTDGGIILGDIITQADGRKITTADEWYSVLERHKPGDTIELTIWREGRAADVKLQLEPPRE